MKRKQFFLMLPVVGLALCLLANVVLAMDQASQEVAAVDAGAGSDLVLTSISGPAKAFLNQTISLTYHVENQGAEDSGAYRVRLYLSRDTVIDPDADHLVKEVAFPGGLPAGQSKKTTTRVTVPELGTGRFYYGGAVGTSSSVSSKQVAIVRFEADDANGTVTDHRSGLMWQRADDGTMRTWGEAVAYCDQLVLGGHEDWRLPRIKQLLSIVSYSHYDPAIYSAFDVRRGHYWSSSVNVYYYGYAFQVYFFDGSVSWDSWGYYYYVRCVRGGPW
jgi:hypothetical protein